MATINGVEVIGDKSAHDFDLLDKDDGINLANGVERNRKATEDNHQDIVLHRTDRDVHVTPEWKNSLVSKEMLGLYWTAAQTADIINEISIAGGAKLVKVDVLPETGLEQTIYLVPKTDPQEGDVFDEYVWIDNKFEFIGTTKVDLSNYATKTELNAKQDALSNQQIQNIADVTNKANDVDVVHKSGDIMSGDLIGNGSNNLGTSFNKWKTINGIDPGALSLPSSSFITIDTSGWLLDGTLIAYTPQVDGWLTINVNCSDNGHYIKIAQGGLYNICGYNGSRVMRLISPVHAGTVVNINVVGDSWSVVRLFRCMGKV